MADELNLKKTRTRIDRLDSEIMKLLNERMELALETSKFKGEVEDSKREEEVLAHVQRAPELIRGEFSEKLFKEILHQSKKIQKQKSALAGFQGEHGAYSEMAAKKLPDAVPIPCTTFIDVFEGVRGGRFDYGVVPVDNSLGGSVTEVNDLLVETDLYVVAEVALPIRHCLLVPPETDYREIRIVYSHPQALSQCRGFLQRNKLEPRPYYDTAGAARMIARETPKAAAAIANRLSAELYGLEIIKENIEDHNSNITRFFVLAREKSTTGNKCSIVFSTAHKAGALFEVLRVFAEAKINLTRIESRPVAKDPGKFAFIVDLEGSETEERVAAALEKVKVNCERFRLLGCYKTL